jgi:hypothetical protein
MEIAPDARKWSERIQMKTGDLHVYEYRAPVADSWAKFELATVAGDVAPHLAIFRPDGTTIWRAAWRDDPGRVMVEDPMHEKGTYWVVVYAERLMTQGAFRMTAEGFRPYVDDTYPRNGTRDVWIGNYPVVEFSDPMDEGSVARNIDFWDNGVAPAEAAAGGNVPFDILWLHEQAMLKPRPALEPYHEYTIVVGRGCKNTAGRSLIHVPRVTFSTGPGLIEHSTPHDGETGVSRLTPVTIKFGGKADEEDVELKFVMKDGAGVKIPGTFKWLNPELKVRFTPTQPLRASATYTVTMRPGVHVHYMPFGTRWSESFTFTTGDRPIIVRYSPRGDEVPLSSVIRATFDRPMLHGSVSQVRIDPPGTGTFSWSADSREMTFTPDSPLWPSTWYTVRIGADAEAQDGQTLGADFDWRFSTGDAGASSPLSLVLSAAAAPTKGDGAQITVTLSAPASVGATIYNVAGRVVAVLPSRELPPGTSTLLWSGRSVTGAPAPAGRYLVAVEARSATGGTARQLVGLQR